MNDNPLLDQSGLPRFDLIKAEHVEPAIDHLLEHNRKMVDQIVAESQPPTWDNFVEKLEALEEQLSRAWSPANHLHSVADNEDLRKAYNACLPKLSDYGTEMGQHEGMFHAFQSLADSDEYQKLTPAQQKIIDNAIRDFRLSGIDLEDADKARYKALQQELSQLQTRFEENILDATNAWKKHITDVNDLDGLPESALALAQQQAAQKELEGYVLTLDFPSYLPVMQYANDRKLREEMYHAYSTRASELGANADKWDNSKIMQEIVAKRYELAQLLGFESYAHRSLATKMASEPKEVMQFLEDLAERSHTVASADYQEIVDFAKQQGHEQLQSWDMAFFSEKLKQEKYELSDEELRPYFPAPKVIDGLFAVVKRLYGLQIKPRNDVASWHKDVTYYDIYDESSELRGSFYLDLYARQHKRGGAWMDECIVRKRTASGIQAPVAYLTCNFTPPIGSDPSLLTHNEVITLFHEFGHGLHHMLTKVEFAGVSGINGVAWDAVELPSQFMENWCWEKEALALISGHYKTGEPIPDDLYQRMLAAKNFQSGMAMVRQLEFALFDFRLHLEYSSESKTDIQALLNEVREQVAVFSPPAYNRFQHSFSHIFAGGYAAGYYSYKWAEVLSADAFSKFEERGIFDRNTGLEFLHAILEQGGSREPMDLFVEFRGRKPSVDALLRHSGIAA